MTDRTKSRHAVYEIRYHFVWCPKYRRPVLTGEIANRLEGLIHEIVSRELMGRVLNLQVHPDHVHLFVEVPPMLAPRQIMHRIKGYTSHVLRKEFPSLKSRLPSLWTRTYYAGTAGRVSQRTIQQYIEAQKGK